MTAPRPLQNRVDPMGELQAVAARGALMGNRGGRFHRDDGTLGRRRWASRHGSLASVRSRGAGARFGDAGYTELFFLDEATAFAAGHRPCFECRRADALRFAAAFAAAGPVLPAAAMDEILHRERLDGRVKRRFRADLATLPDGAFVLGEGGPMLVAGAALHPWRFDGYGPAAARPAGGPIEVLTPPSIVAALRNGYRAKTALTGAGASPKVANGDTLRETEP